MIGIDVDNATLELLILDLFQSDKDYGWFTRADVDFHISFNHHIFRKEVEIQEILDNLCEKHILERTSNPFAKEAYMLC